jgi:hypothetical protein
LQGDPICCEEETRQCEAFGVCGCPECECFGTPNRPCSLFSTKTCCPGMVCTPVPIFPLLTTCQFPCENNQQCRDVFGRGYRCTDGDDCTFIGKCCQIPFPGDRGAGVSKVGWPRDGDQFDALAKLVWTRTSRGAALGTMAGVALPWRTRSAAFGPKGKTGFAAGPGATRAPRRARR